MKCTIEGKQLADSLKSLSLTEAAQASLVAKKGLISISATNSGVTVEHKIEVPSLEGTAKVSFSLPIFAGLVKNRKNITLEYQPENNQLIVSSTDNRSKYSTKFSTVDYTDIEVQLPKESVVIEPEVHKELLTAIKQMSIDNVYGNHSSLYYLVSLTPEGLTTACYDDFHSAYRHNTSIKGNFSFALPVKSWDKIRKILGDVPYSLSVDFSKVVVQSHNTYLTLPIVQNDKLSSLDMLKEYVAQLPVANSYLDMEVETLKKSLGNIKGIFEQEIPVVFSATKEGVLTLTLKTNYGEITEKLKVEHHGFTNKSFSVDPSLLNDILNVYPLTELRLNISDAFIWIDSKCPKDNDIRYVYILSLSGE